MSRARGIALHVLRRPPDPSRSLRRSLLALGLLLASCQRGAPAGRVQGTAQPAAASPIATPEGLPMPAGAPAPVEETRPVYPTQLDGPESPQAKALCQALHELPDARRRECCASTPGMVLMGDCVRVLTYAQRSGAVRIDDQALSACVAGMQKTYSGCDWVGPWPPELPADCRAVLRGTLAGGARCRSSLECQDGLFCHGAGPTAMGICGTPRVEGERCGHAVDALAAYVRMAVLTEPHPQFAPHRECVGFCNMRHVCESVRARGDDCVMSVQCGADDRCGRGKCIAGRVAGVGEACSGGDCAAGLRCFQHKCQMPKPRGESCSWDFECSGGCERLPTAERGICAPKCSAG